VAAATAFTPARMAMKFTHAIVSRVPDVYAKLPTVDGRPVDLGLARKQHADLVRGIREKMGLDVLELPPDESNAMSVFTQDLAVVVNGIALMCRPVNSSRKPEVDTMRAVLKKELDQVISEPESGKALLNGSDVFFTGREFFVGLSSHTNTDGAVAVASTWPEYPCTPIKVDGPFTLKHYLTMAGPDVISVGSSPEAQTILRRVEREATHRYQTLTLPEDGPSNCLMLNGTLVHRSREEAPKSDAVFSAKVDYDRLPVAISEFQRTESQCPLSGLFLLIRKTKHVRRI